MPGNDHILDNRQSKVVDYLQKRLPGAETLRLVSAYFSIYGYELLAQELQSVGKVRFLFGEPGSVSQLDPGAREPKSYDLTERGLVPNHTLHQKSLALQCADWVGSDTVAIRSIKQSNFLHGKMYLTDSPENGAGVVGSSNFTRSGLGGGKASNVEINLATLDPATLSELSEWFDELWQDGELTSDAKHEVLAALSRIGHEHDPEFIYYKTLYELFKSDLEAQRDDQQLRDIHLFDTAVWNALYEFQKDGAKSVISRLKRNNGCILADSVGLGKTYTALAVIKYYELRNERALVLCPNKLRENWALYPAYRAHRHNPFLGDRFNYTVLSHTDLSRDTGMSDGIDLKNFNWSGFDLIVIDESHNFRNSDGIRYERLIEEVIKQGVKTKVLMLSATPVNTSLTDLRNQIYLMTEKREDDFLESLGIGDIRGLMAAAQREFKQWESKPLAIGRRDKAELLERLGADFLRLLESVSISRSRRQVQRFYADEMQRIGQFPKQQKPVNRHPPTDLHGKLSYKDLAERIGTFALSVYRPSDYLVSEARKRQLEEERKVRNFNQQDREHWLIGMMRINFLKRLESSAHSLTLTLDRTIRKIDDLLQRIDRYENGLRSSENKVDSLPDEDEDDEDLVINRGRYPYRLDELDLPKWKSDLSKDKDTLTAVWQQVGAITSERDGKLKAIKQAVRDKMRNPTADRDGKPNRKLLVFTTFKDTAEYVYENLEELAGELDVNMAMVSGDATHTSTGHNSYNEILSNFSPVSRNRGAVDAAEIDLLIATDCISEGQNLQDCDMVLNYDIHWNPVRIIQRFGRIDRIGSRSRSVRMLNYWPTEDMEVYLRLHNRVQARMALADLAASGDEDPFTEERAQQELRFRDEQLRRLRKEILDLDEFADGVVMSDFTLDHFFAQLMQYLEKNRDELEATPAGAYAVAPAVHPEHACRELVESVEGRAAPRPGVIFFLRQRNASIDRRQKPASPIHPFYMAYIYDDGQIRFGCANARQVLNVFEAAAAGKTEPIMRLCDWFDSSTDYGKDMTRYDKLLTDVIDHVRQSNSKSQARNLGRGGDRGFSLPKLSETPRQTSDFELVTWLVIAPPLPRSAAP